MSDCAHCGDSITGAETEVSVPADRLATGLSAQTLCEGCHKIWVHTPRSSERSDDPTIHQWITVDAAVEGRGSMATYAVERCLVCGDLRIDKNVEVIEEVSDA